MDYSSRGLLILVGAGAGTGAGAGAGTGAKTVLAVSLVLLLHQNRKWRASKQELSVPSQSCLLYILTSD